ncbi:hypothetical protein FQN54_005482 [Arachnomyces sp. PD_36]|nr:hypothetical protein FQN54_005482 [Arachnomyces sp. PD_36]
MSSLQEQGPDSEFHDTKRRSLIHRLYSLLTLNVPDTPCYTVAQSFWGAIWLCDLEKLEEITRFAETASLSMIESIRKDALLEGSILIHYLIMLPDPVPYGSQARQACHARDNGTCVITNDSSTVKQVYIIPMKGNPVLKVFDPYSWMHLFWTPSRVNEWKDIISTKNEIDVCENMITMSPSLFSLWKKCLFALKPLEVSPDKKSMEVQFFWLQKLQKRAGGINFGRRPKSLLPADPKGHSEEFSSENVQTICSGAKFTLQTDDPENKPLPSKELLELHWILHRLLALSGTRVRSGDSDDEDEVDFTDSEDEHFD